MCFLLLSAPAIPAPPGKPPGALKSLLQTGHTGACRGGQLGGAVIACLPGQVWCLPLWRASCGPGAPNSMPGPPLATRGPLGTTLHEAACPSGAGPAAGRSARPVSCLNPEVRCRWPPRAHPGHCGLLALVLSGLLLDLGCRCLLREAFNLCL